MQIDNQKPSLQTRKTIGSFKCSPKAEKVLQNNDNSKIYHKYISLVDEDQSVNQEESRPNVAKDSTISSRRILMTGQNKRPRFLNLNSCPNFQTQKYLNDGEENLVESPLAHAKLPVIEEYKNIDRNRNQNEFQLSPQLIKTVDSSEEEDEAEDNSNSERIDFKLDPFQAFRQVSETIDPRFNPFKWCKDFDNVIDS